MTLLFNTTIRWVTLIFFGLVELSALSVPLDEPIKPIVIRNNFNLNKVELGEQLFNEKKLSGDGKIACSTCHDLANAGIDGRPTSVGVDGVVLKRNSPTVFNASLHFRQFWDGRAKNLIEQANGPITNPEEMNGNWEVIINFLTANPDYSKKFVGVYGASPNRESVLDAIAHFEETLLTADAPFDLYLKGQSAAITPEEKRGYELFKALGCISCHQGVAIGGNMFQKFGIMGDYFQDRGFVSEADFGLFNKTKKESDKYRFKVPSLRNITRTAPYFHDGSVATLEEAVRIMAKYQLGKQLETREVNLIVKFLRTLTGQYKGNKI